jgi:methionyl-tRNA formyltransferase
MTRVVLLGSKQMGLRCLAGMHGARPGTVVGLVTVDDTADSRCAFDELQEFSSGAGIPRSVVTNAGDLDAAIRRFDPELVIACGWYRMIAEATLALPVHGFIGVHNSLLPRYRGAAPLVWAMLNGERQVGISMFTLTGAMDEGDVWAQRATPVHNGDYIGDVLGRLEDACEEMMRVTYPQILDGTVRPVPQNHAEATFGAWRQPDDGRVDWRRSAEQLYREVRAQSSPYPGAFTSLGGRRLTVWRAGLFRAPYFGRPGQLVRGPAQEPLVVCGDNRALQLELVQFDGDAAGPAEIVLRGCRDTLGSGDGLSERASG